MGDLTKNFSRSEFACRCGCGFDKVDKRALFKLQVARDEYRQEMKINSGCRCEVHNEQQGGKPTSAHLTGRAFDIKCQYSRDRFRLVNALIQAGFKRIGIGSTFIHADDDEDKDQLVMWLY